MSSSWQRSKVRLLLSRFKWLGSTKIRKRVCGSLVFITESMQGLKTRHPGVHLTEMVIKSLKHYSLAISRCNMPLPETWLLMLSELKMSCVLKIKLDIPIIAEKTVLVFPSESRVRSQTERWFCVDSTCGKMPIKCMPSIVSGCFGFGWLVWFFCVYLFVCVHLSRGLQTRSKSKKTGSQSLPM